MAFITQPIASMWMQSSDINSRIALQASVTRLSGPRIESANESAGLAGAMVTLSGGQASRTGLDYEGMANIFRGNVAEESAHTSGNTIGLQVSDSMISNSLAFASPMSVLSLFG